MDNNGLRYEILRRIEQGPLLLCIFPVSHAIWYLFVVKVNEKSGMTRNDFIRKLRQLNISTGIHFLPVNSLSYYSGSDSGATPQAGKVGNTCVSLPLYPLMSDDDEEYVIFCIKEIFSQV